MAARTVHCFFKNLTDQTLSRESEHLEHGIYTEPTFPPQTIAPGAVGEWRSESDGFMTGTEGRARYRIASEGGTEFIDLWWDNPFIGGNKSSIVIVQDFTGNSSKIFEGANHIDGSPPPNLVKMGDGDVEAWIDAVLFPPYIVANAPIANDANAVFAVRRRPQVSSPLFGPQGSGPRSSRINTSHKTTEWEGLWASNDVSVTIVSLGGGNMTASVTDTTANPTLELQEAFRLGQLGWAFNAFALSMHREFHTLGYKAQSAVIRAATQAIRLQHTDEREHTTATIYKAVQADLYEQNFKIPDPKLARATKAASAVAKLPRSTVMLSHGICLTLYDDFEAGQKMGSHMLYERINSWLGLTLASERLSFYPMLH